MVLVLGDGHCIENWGLVRDVWKVKWIGFFTQKKIGLVFVGHTLELKPTSDGYLTPSPLLVSWLVSLVNDTIHLLQLLIISLDEKARKMTSS